MPTIQRIAEAIRSAATWFATLCFAAVVVGFAFGVVMRYVLRNPSDTAGELTVILYLWAVMIGGSLAITLDTHVSFDLLVERLPRRASRAVEALGALIAGGVLLYALPTTVDYVLFLWREKTPALEWSLDKVYFCFIVFQAAMAVMLLARAARLAFGLDHGDGVASPQAQPGQPVS